MSTQQTTNQFQPADYSKLNAVNVSFNRPAKWYMYIVKRVLHEKNEIEIKARPSAAAQAIRVAEALKRLGYLDIVNYSTTTVSDTRGLDRFLIINVAKTKDFNKLYDAREEERTRLMAGTQQGNQGTQGTTQTQGR